MKKIMVYLVSFVMLLMPFGLCEESDVTSMTDEQLNKLLISVEQEIAERDGYLSNFYGSDVLYTVGDDIESGVYIVSCIKKYNSAVTGAQMEYWATKEDYSLYTDNSSEKTFVILGESTKIKLQEGNVFIIKGGVLTFDKID